MQLSTSALNTFFDCQLCSYLDKNFKVKRPRGIFPSLPGGVDLVLKDRMDYFSGELPKELKKTGQLDGWRLFSDREALNHYRQWNDREALKYIDSKGNKLVGALDDMLENPSGNLFAPLDYKTKGSETEYGAETPDYYKRQLDIYAFLMSTKYDVADFGVLFYFWPVADLNGLVGFDCKPVIVDVSAARGKALFESALEVLEAKEAPAASAECEYCKYHQKRIAA